MSGEQSPVTSRQSSVDSRQSSGPAADLLETIVAGTRRIVEVRQTEESFAALAARAAAVPSRAGRFQAALARTDRHNVIAECKRRSPSRGVLRADYDPVAIAIGYAAAGAAAISVLTEPTFFDGSLDHLISVRAAVDVPVLRKDFVVSEYQVLEAKVSGADAVLLIVAALRPPELKVLHDHAQRHGLDVLVEVHDSTELSIAIDAGARIIGVNNRNLRTLQVDVHASEALIAHIPPDVIAVSESGLKTGGDLAHLKALGYRAFLIGERFMAAAQPGAALMEIMGGASSAGTSAPNAEDRTSNAEPRTPNAERRTTNDKRS
jgi:indole-3-glycerol phosphate synthase